MKNTILFAIAALLVSACAPSPDNNANSTSKWYGQGVISVGREGEKQIPQKEILGCRVLSADQKTHHYVYVSAAKTDNGTPMETGVVFENAVFSVTKVEIEPNSVAMKMMSLLSGRLVIENTDSGATTYKFFSEEMEVLHIFTQGGININQTKTKLPGFTYGGQIECR